VKEASDKPRRTARQRLPLALCALALLLAAQLWTRFQENPRSRWNGIVHDRNGHYAYGLKMADALRHGDVARFFTELEKGKAWPPLHGLLVAPTQLPGSDWRRAVWPSLAGWALMTVCVALLAGRVAEPLATSRTATAVAFILAALSPAHRIFATDIMLESLGAGLTALALVLYSRAAERRDDATEWRGLALVLTLLFFEKYNYWLIVALALAAAECAARNATPVATMRRMRAWPWGALVRRELRQPLTLLALAFAALVTWIHWRGPTTLDLGTLRVPLYPPNNLLTAAYAALFLRVALAVRRQRWQPDGVAARMLWKWHALPVAFSFLLPQRLAAFAGFLSPANYGDAPVRTFAEAARFYARAFAMDYHANVPLAVATALCAVIAMTACRRFSPRIIAPMACVLISLALTLAHPNQKSRFLHSWLPMVWALAGAGVAWVLANVRPLLLRRAFCAMAIAAATLAGGRAWMSPGHSPEAGNRGESTSLLDVSDAWLAEVGADDKVAFVATQECRALIEWTFLAAGHKRQRLECFRPPGPRETTATQDALARWLAASDADLLVTLEIPPGSPLFTKVADKSALRTELPLALAAQSRFALSVEKFVQGATVRVWRQAGVSRDGG
jgi:hypothetical protein